MEYLSIHIDSRAISASAGAASKNEVFKLLASKAADAYGLDAILVEQGLREREGLGSTGFGNSIAIPHAKLPEIEQCIGLFLQLEKPIPFEAHDAQNVDLIFCLLSPEQAGSGHLKALAEISRFLRDEQMTNKLRGADSADALYVLLTGQKEQRAA